MNDPSKKKCKACGEVWDRDHYCRVAQRTVTYDDSNFMLSMLVGYATDNAVIGGVVGGSFIGGLMGEGLRDDSPTPATPDNPDFGGGSFGGGGAGGSIETAPDSTPCTGDDAPSYSSSDSSCSSDSGGGSDFGGGDSGGGSSSDS